VEDVRCKQGQLVIILKTLTGNNIGRIVTAAEYIGYLEQHQQFEYRGNQLAAPITDHYWWITVAGDRPLETAAGPTTKAYSPDGWLKPILPDEDDDLTTTEKDHEDALSAS
jgi:hypothetical protein